MSLSLESWQHDSSDRLGALARHESLADEFERLRDEGRNQILSDVFAPEGCRVIARWNGEDVGFGLGFIVPTVTHRFAIARFGVTAPHRRRGIGSAILAELVARARSAAPDIRELEISAFLPNEPAEAFATHHGYAPRRRYWMMQRADAPCPPPDWNDGASVRAFDGSEADLALWTELFNRTWRDHDHPIVATVEEMRTQIASGAFAPGTMFLAEREGRPIGFVRASRLEGRGEISILGIAPEARGHGHGRAMLRFGVARLIEQGATPVTLFVDGENERALRLYRQEAFDVTRTRQLWSREP